MAPANAPKISHSGDLGIRRPEKLVAEGKVKDMLRSEIRDELNKRGLSPVGKPWEIKERLEAAILTDLNRDLHVPAAEPSPPPSPPPPSAAAVAPSSLSSAQPAASAAEKRASYAAKLRARTGGSILSDGTIVSTNSVGGARPLAAHERPPDEGISWRMQPGARELLTYCDMRNIYRLLLPAGVDSEAEAIEQAARMVGALQVPDFGRVLSLEEASSVRRGEPSAITRAVTALDLTNTSNLMVVSDEAAVLRAAKAARVYSCFFAKRLPNAPKSRPADFHADDPRGVQTAIEDINGVTYRDADTEIRTKFGVYQT